MWRYRYRSSTENYFSRVFHVLHDFFIWSCTDTPALLLRRFHQLVLSQLSQLQLHTRPLVLTRPEVLVLSLSERITIVLQIVEIERP